MVGLPNSRREEIDVQCSAIFTTRHCGYYDYSILFANTLANGRQHEPDQYTTGNTPFGKSQDASSLLLLGKDDYTY